VTLWRGAVEKMRQGRHNAGKGIKMDCAGMEKVREERGRVELVVQSGAFIQNASRHRDMDWVEMSRQWRESEDRVGGGG